MTISMDILDDEYVHVTPVTGTLSGLTAFTAAGWIRPVSLTGDAFRTTMFNGWWLSVTSTLHRQALLRFAGTDLQAFVYSGGAQTGGNVGLTGTLNAWQHIAMTYDSVAEELIGYRNGVAGGTTYAPTGAITTDDNNHALGQHTSEYADANFADRAVWNVAQPPTVIADIYNHKLRALLYPVGLIEYWPLDVKGDTFPVSTNQFQDGDFGARDLAGENPAKLGTAPVWDIGLDIPLTWAA